MKEYLVKKTHALAVKILGISADLLPWVMGVVTLSDIAYGFLK